MMKKYAAALIVLFVVLLLAYGIVMNRNSSTQVALFRISPTLTKAPYATFPLSISFMRQRAYPGSMLKIEQTLSPMPTYHQYIASYQSQGLKIYGLLTIPVEPKPKAGWPVIVFNHGYIPPDQYRTTERYVAYVDAFARNGYIVFKPDYRGNGSSEGTPEGAYYSPAYTIDDLNAVASVKKLPEANPNNLGIWGHSMGGNITLRDLVIEHDIKAAVIWGGVVGTYSQILNWHDPTYHPPTDIARRSQQRQSLIKKYGTPQSNPLFWQAIDPTNFVKDITTPIQLDVGSADVEVPPAFSQTLLGKLKEAGKIAEYYEYPGGDHNISEPNFDLAMQRSLAFFDKYLK